MKNVSNVFCLLFFLLSWTLNAQSTSEKLKKEQSRLEKKISNTKALLNKTKSKTEQSLNALRLIDTQIKFREELVMNFDNQVRSAEIRLREKSNEIKRLQDKLERLKAQYKKLLLYSYKHRNKFGRMMFIFSASSYNEAIKRTEYLRHVAEIQNKQFLMIRQHQGMIADQIGSIEKDKTYKQGILEEKKLEKQQIEEDKKKQEQTYNKFRQEESKLLTQLKDDERKKEVLKQKIAAAIQKEIAEIEARRKKAEAEAKKNTASKTSETAAKGGGKTETAPEKKEFVFAETKESAALSKNFEGNKGKLPWPVDKGSITEGFGRNPHPTLDNVFTNNNGIDISTNKGAQVRAVFEGEVTSVLNIPGAGKVLILKHGNYRTVYSNLQDTYVKIGSKVTTKQAIGSILPQDDSGVSVVHFEIHMVAGTAVQCLNPSLWVKH